MSVSLVHLLRQAQPGQKSFGNSLSELQSFLTDSYACPQLMENQAETAVKKPELSQGVVVRDSEGRRAQGAQNH